MMDEREDRFDEFLRHAARSYNAPPETPKAEMWERIRAERAVRRSGSRVLPFRGPTLRVLLAIAAVLILGVAIGRLTAPVTAPPASAPGTIAAGPERTPTAKEERGELASRLATTNHLTQVEMFLTEFGNRTDTTDFSDQARDLLGTTRLLLDSKRVADPQTRRLLQDLELVLIQIATLNPKDRREDLDFIADGLAQNQLRSRLRNAIPAGPAIRM
jgi:hypothetical protein